MNRTSQGSKPAVRTAASATTPASRADHLIDLAPRSGNPSMDDDVAFRKNSPTPSGVRVASVQTHAMVTAPSKNARHTFEGMITLKRGLLAVVERPRFNDTRHHITITGGTEQYDGATGSTTSGLPGQGPKANLRRSWTT